MAHLTEGKRLLSHKAAESPGTDVTVEQDLRSADSTTSDNDGLGHDEVVGIGLEITDKNSDDLRRICGITDNFRDAGFGGEGEPGAVNSVTEDSIRTTPSDIEGIIRATANGKREWLNIAGRPVSESIQDSIVANRIVVLIGSDVQDPARLREQCVEFRRSDGVFLAFVGVG